MKYNPRVVDAYYRTLGLPKPVFELVFAPPRRWRFDIAWPDHKLAIEVQGGIFTGGRHTRGAALIKEHEKLNKSASMGWRVLFIQPCDLCMNDTIILIKESLWQSNPEPE